MADSTPIISVVDPFLIFLPVPRNVAIRRSRQCQKRLRYPDPGPMPVSVPASLISTGCYEPGSLTGFVLSSCFVPLLIEIQLKGKSCFTRAWTVEERLYPSFQGDPPGREGTLCQSSKSTPLIITAHRSTAEKLMVRVYFARLRRPRDSRWET